MTNPKLNIARGNYFKLMFWMMLPALMFSCTKTKIKPVTIYPQAPEALVKFLDGKPNPSIGTVGSVVEFKVQGLEGKVGQFDFFVNQTKAEVLEATANTVKVKIPENASTGGSAILINGEYYFGPTFKVRGKISIDPTFKTDVYRSNDVIFNMVEWNSSAWMICGAFTDYQKQANSNVKVPGIALLEKNSLAFQDAGSTESQFAVGKQGIHGIVTSVVSVANGKFLISGSVNQYDTITNIHSITRINQDGSIDSMTVAVVGVPPLDKATVPSFNGGVIGNAGQVFYDDNTGEVTLIGNFFAHVSTFYERSSVDGPFLDYVEMRNLVRMNEDGSFDSTFNYNAATNKGYGGANGIIYDAVQVSNGDYIAAGNFTTFHGQTANHIVRIKNSDGTVDGSFSGSADGDINRVLYNETTGNIILSGDFKNYNGQPANGVVMIDENGAIVPTFQFAQVDGVVNFAGQMNNGLIIVSGSFTHYGDVVREGIAFLNPDGTLAAGYNNSGLFRGQIRNFIETTSSAGVPALILYGSFDRFDNAEVGNIVKIKIEN